MKIYPKCHPYWIIDGEKINIKPKTLHYTGEGFILPCCWCHTPEQTAMKQFDMINENLNVKNINSLDEIYKSKQWVNFHYTLLNDPENAPKICKEGCGSNDVSVHVVKQHFDVTEEFSSFEDE